MAEIIPHCFSYSSGPNGTIQCCHSSADSVCSILSRKCPFSENSFPAEGKNIPACANTSGIIQKQNFLVAVECLRFLRGLKKSASIGTHIFHLPCQCTRSTHVSVNSQEGTLWHFDRSENSSIIHRECGKKIYC